MRSSDFRVGNSILNPYDEITDVDITILDYIDQCNSVQQKVERYKYVPITKENLRKLGCKQGYWYISIFNLKAEIHFEFYGKEVVTILRSDFCELILDPLKYIHEVQNLYKELSKQELKITE